MSFPESSNMNILIVDDEEVLRHGIKAMIERMDLPFTVVGMAEDGVQALEQLEQLEPDVILSDIRMPRLGGLELIQLATAQYPKVRSIILSGYDDFEYAKRAIRLGCKDYLAKPPSFSELRELLLSIYKERSEEKEKLLNETRKSEIINRNQLLIRTDFLRSLTAKSGVLRTTDIRERAKGIGLNLDEEHYAIATLKFEKQAELRKKYNSAEWELLKYAAWNITEEMLGHPLCFYDEASHLIMLMKEPLSTEECIEKCMALRYNINHFLNLKASISISQPVPLSSIGVAYKEASQLLSIRWVREKSVVVTSSDTATLTNDNIQYHLDQLLGLFKADDTREICSKLNSWVLSVKGSAYSPTALERLAQELKIAMITLYSNLLVSDEDSKTQGLSSMPAWLERLELADSLMELISPLLLAVERLDLKEQSGTLLHNRTIEQAIAYIRARFNSNLNLSSIAEKVNMNPTYFSVFFKKKTGKGVIEYLTGIRMEEAKKLLQETDSKTYQVAEQVGYPDAAYFSNQFKRYTGMTPQEFRNKGQL